MRWRSPLSLLLPLLLLLGRETASGFKICSYNIQGFNGMKAANNRLIHTLTRVVFRCDICLLQNVVDPAGKAVKTLLSSVNRYDGHVYKAVSSKALGRSKDDMQQYVFIYRKQAVNVTGQFQYESKPPAFARDPFAVHFQSNQTDIKSFTLVPLHSDPSQAVQEMDRLYDVFLKVRDKWSNSNVMFLGDFHAGCAYMTRRDKKKIRLFTNSSFSWLIGDKVDTTVMDETNCPYDRIVVHGKPFLKAIHPFSAKVYNFAKELKLGRSKVLEVSDHFPLEVTLKSSALLLQATPLLVLLGVSALLALDGRLSCL